MSRAARIELVPARMLSTQPQVMNGGHYSAEYVDGSWTYTMPAPGVRFVANKIGRGRRAKATEPHYLRLVAGNGQVLATSELYANKANAKRAVGTWVTAFYDVWSSGLPVVEVES